MFMRVHAGSYISACGGVKIRRRLCKVVVGERLRERWVWDVLIVDSKGVFQYGKTLRTLKVAKEYARRFVVIPMYLP